ncbi:DUF1295 domain-containing protein [Actinomadura scrupuli]|uniref:DUF1295 domain-containing protein n=1 Tax=Actinomadura scrupuli TaxID=559629 RepID=UPI003D97A182
MSSFALAPFLWNLPLTAVTVAVVLAITYAVALRAGRHSVIDVAWGLGFAAVALVTCAASAGQAEGSRRWLITALTVVWGVRLAAHVAWRSRGKGEDRRYEELLSRAPGDRNRYALRKVYFPQGVVLWFVSLPVQVAMYAGGPAGRLLLVGALIWAAGFLFETVGDFQLARFTGDPANRGEVMDGGLWRYTRHPNYFGDALVWWGIFLAACDQWPGALTVLSPVLMTWLLARGTGKPLLERSMERTRPGYAGYAARTSGFVPWPPRRPGPEE